MVRSMTVDNVLRLILWLIVWNGVWHWQAKDVIAGGRCSVQVAFTDSIKTVHSVVRLSRTGAKSCIYFRRRAERYSNGSE